jgi:hypothetical protein
MFEHKAGNPTTRREALRRVGNGFGMMAFASAVSESLLKAGVSSPDGSVMVGKLDYPQRVKRVIFLFMNGGCSTLDSFDPKPALEKYDGQPLPGGDIKTERRTGELMKSPFKFKKYGQSGMDFSELWPRRRRAVPMLCAPTRRAVPGFRMTMTSEGRSKPANLPISLCLPRTT